MSMINIDQADNLRRMMEKISRGVNVGFLHVIEAIFFQGKPVFVLSGAEREVLSLSNLSGNLAIALAKFNQRVAVLDAHSHSINTALILGIDAPISLTDVEIGQRVFSDALYSGPVRTRFIRGVEVLENVHMWESSLHDAFVRDMQIFLRDSADIIFINEIDLRFSFMLPEVIMVFSPSEESKIKAYQRLKKIYEANPQADASFIINNAHSLQEAEAVAANFTDTVKKFLGKDIECSGIVCLNSDMIRSIKLRKPFMIGCRYTRAAERFRLLARKMMDDRAVRTAKGCQETY